MRSGLALAAMVMATTAQAGTFWDGNKLYSKLNGSSTDQMHGLGYIMGVADTMDTINICSPLNVTAGQMNDIVRQYLDAYPTLRHNAADIIVTRALSRVWPCDRKGQSL